MEEIQSFIQSTLNKTEGNITYMDICLAFNGITIPQAQQELLIFSQNHNQYHPFKIGMETTPKEFIISSNGNQVYMLSSQEQNDEYFKLSMDKYFSSDYSKKRQLENVITTEHIFQSDLNASKEIPKTIQKRKSFVITTVNKNDEEKKPQKVTKEHSEKGVVSVQNSQKKISSFFGAKKTDTKVKLEKEHDSQQESQSQSQPESVSQQPIKQQPKKKGLEKFFSISSKGSKASSKK